VLPPELVVPQPATQQPDPWAIGSLGRHAILTFSGSGATAKGFLEKCFRLEITENVLSELDEAPIRVSKISVGALIPFWMIEHRC